MGTERARKEFSRPRVAKEAGSNRKLGLWQVGDVFKADGWKGPARTARGNLFDEQGGLGRAGEYSVR